MDSTVVYGTCMELYSELSGAKLARHVTSSKLVAPSALNAQLQGALTVLKICLTTPIISYYIFGYILLNFP